MSSEYGELVGIDSLYYALVSADSASEYTAGANTYLAPAGDITHEASSNTKIRYYDNRPYFVSISESETGVTITVSNVPLSRAAALTGKPYDSTRGIVIDTGDASKAPWCAFSGRMELGDGGYRYFQYLKGKFSYTKMEATSKTSDISEKTAALMYTAVRTTYEFADVPDPEDAESTITSGVKGIFADSTNAAFTAGDDWFDQVQTPDSIGAPSAIALSTIVPADDATGVAVTADIVLTFNNKIASESVTVISAAGAIVANAKTWDATGKILTINPSSSLSATTVYIVSVSGVVDIYGQELAAVAKNFETAS